MFYCRYFALLFLLPCSASADLPVAVLDLKAEQVKGRTAVWSPLFQAGWDVINKTHGGKPIRVVPENPLIKQLDEFVWDEKKVMPANGYGVYAGQANKEFAMKVKADIRKKYGVDVPLQIPPENLTIPAGQEHDRLAVYGILVKNVQYSRKFYSSKKKNMTFTCGDGAKHQVKFFGTTGETSAKYFGHVTVLLAAKQSYALSVSTRDGTAAIFYMPLEMMSFDSAIKEVREMIKNPASGKLGSGQDRCIHSEDTVKIPYLDLEMKTRFTSQLQGLRYYENKKFPRKITMAYQYTKFELTEKGAKVRVHTGSVDDPLGGSPPKNRCVPRSFIFDRPFYVFLWRHKAEHPYFAAWIDGKEGMKVAPAE